MKTPFTRRAPVASQMLALALIASLALAAPRTVVGAPSYSITDLGTLGGQNSRANGTGVNANGQATGFAQLPNINDHAFLYSDGSLIDIGTLPGGSVSLGYGINGSGQITGQSDTQAGTNHAFLYSNGNFTDLGTLPGYDTSIGFALNDNGDVTGDLRNATGGDTNDHAFLYSNGTMIKLGTLGGTSSHGNGINNKGQVVGYSYLPQDAADHAFLYSSGEMTDLGTLGGANSFGIGINNNGQVTGESNTKQGATHAFLYTNGAMTDLGILGSSSSGNSINNSSQIVGQFVANRQSHAFLASNGVMANLENLIGPNTHWRLLYASSLSDTGYIVGTGEHNNQQRAFLLTPLNPLAYLSLPQYAVTGGTTLTATVILTQAAPAGGTVIHLTSSNANAATVPAQITIAQGQTGKTFPITTHTVTAKTPAAITAGDGNITRTQTLTVNP